MAMKSLITQDPKILGGKPIITGTRMSVEVILELLHVFERRVLPRRAVAACDAGSKYPFLTKAQIQAAVDFAAKLVGKEESYIFDKAQAVAHEISR